MFDTMQIQDGAAPSLTMSQKKEIAAVCFASTEATAKVLFPDRFSLEFSPSHREVFKLLDDDSIPLLAIAAWRGFGKSSIVQLAKPAQQILARSSKFIVPISCTAMQAQMHSENLKRELRYNSIVKDIFEPIKSEIFAKDMWMANNPIGGHPGTLILPRGFGQEVRGVLHMNERPDLVIVDDLEDSETVMSEVQRIKKMEWVYSDVLGAVDKAKPHRIIYIGTVLHEDSLLSNILEDSSWKSIRLELCDDDGVSQWPEQIDDAGVEKLRKRYEERGLLDAFYREFRNLPIAKENAPFQAPFLYYKPEDLRTNTVIYTVLVDPASSDNKNSCDTAIVCAGIDIVNKSVFVVDVQADRMHPDEMAENAIAMCQRWGAKVIGLEVTGLQEFVVWPMQNAIRMSGHGIQLEKLHAEGSESVHTSR